MVRRKSFLLALSSWSRHTDCRCEPHHGSVHCGLVCDQNNGRDDDGASYSGTPGSQLPRNETGSGLWDLCCHHFIGVAHCSVAHGLSEYDPELAAGIWP